MARVSAIIIYFFICRGPNRKLVVFLKKLGSLRWGSPFANCFPKRLAVF